MLGKWFLRCFLQWYWLTVVYGHSVHLNTLHTHNTGEPLPVAGLRPPAAGLPVVLPLLAVVLQVGDVVVEAVGVVAAALAADQAFAVA